MKTYLELNQGKRHINYAYVDVLEHAADYLFIQAKLRARFDEKVPEPRSGNYCVVLCRIKNKDKEKFQLVMEHLSKGLSKNPDYVRACEYLFEDGVSGFIERLPYFRSKDFSKDEIDEGITREEFLAAIDAYVDAYIAWEEEMKQEKEER